MIGEVIHHTLFEDGTITKYDVSSETKQLKTSTEMLTVLNARTCNSNMKKKMRER